MPAMDDPQRHWRELAEQLGLPPEPAEPMGSVPPVPQTREAEINPPAVDANMEEGDQSSLPASVDLTEHAEPSLATETPPVAKPTQPHEERRRTSAGRRRGRRPSRHPEESTAEAEPNEPVGEATSAAEPSLAEGDDGDAPRGRSRRRGRGRSRRKKEAADNSETPVAVEEESEPTQKSPQTAGEDADDEGDDMSGWSIPSWQELIDSLHRPDR